MEKEKISLELNMVNKSMSWGKKEVYKYCTIMCMNILFPSRLLLPSEVLCCLCWLAKRERIIEKYSPILTTPIAP
jgi:hypothetical protein